MVAVFAAFSLSILAMFETIIFIYIKFKFDEENDQSVVNFVRRLFAYRRNTKKVEPDEKSIDSSEEGEDPDDEKQEENEEITIDVILKNIDKIVFAIDCVVATSTASYCFIQWYLNGKEFDKKITGYW